MYWEENQQVLEGISSGNKGKTEIGQTLVFLS